jgi:hypothetical protein
MGEYERQARSLPAGQSAGFVPMCQPPGAGVTLGVQSATACWVVVLREMHDPSLSSTVTAHPIL